MQTPARRLAMDPPHIAQVESTAIYVALAGGVIGALAGLAAAIFAPPLPMYGPLSFASVAAPCAGIIGGLTAGVSYWRARDLPGQTWRRDLHPALALVNLVGVILAHTVLAMLLTLAAFLVISHGFVGLVLTPFWAVAVMAVTLGLAAYLAFLSVVRLSARRMSSLLMAFVGTGTLTAMVTSPDPDWWRLHFSELGTTSSVSSIVFNGTLIIGGLLVTTFAVYVSHDMRRLTDSGVLTVARSPRLVGGAFVIMGLMLAGVGIIPVNVSLIAHNSCATGMAVMYLLLLAGGPWMLRGMPRAYQLSVWEFLVALVATVVLFAVGVFSLTALEIIVFALIFGWIAVFIRFIGVAGQNEQVRARTQSAQMSTSDI